MSFSDQDIDQLSQLAQLQIDAANYRQYASDLSQIVNLVGQLNAIHTDGIKPMTHPVGATQHLSADVVTQDNCRQQLQAVAPKVQAGLYLVPKVIE